MQCQNHMKVIATERGIQITQCEQEGSTPLKTSRFTNRWKDAENTIIPVELTFCDTCIRQFKASEIIVTSLDELDDKKPTPVPEPVMEHAGSYGGYYAEYWD